MAVLVTDDDVLGDAGEQVDGEPLLGVVLAGDDRQTQGIELDDEVSLRRLGERELRQAAQVGIGRTCTRERAAEACAARDLGQPGALGQVEVGARVPDPAGVVDVRAVLSQCA